MKEGGTESLFSTFLFLICCSPFAFDQEAAGKGNSSAPAAARNSANSNTNLSSSNGGGSGSNGGGSGGGCDTPGKKKAAFAKQRPKGTTRAVNLSNNQLCELGDSTLDFTSALGEVMASPTVNLCW